MENLQREDLNPLEAAGAYARLKEEFHLTQEEVARRVGKDRATVANSLRLLKLPASVREKILRGDLSGGHARALAALGSADDCERLSEEVVRRALSVRQTEKRVAAALEGPRLRLTELQLQVGPDLFIGRGSMQDDGRLLLQLSSGARQLRVTGTLAQLVVE